MSPLDKIKQDTDLVNAIDWEMTPEEAVRLYLEWGNNWAQGNYVIRSKDDETTYFVISTWKAAPKIYLIRRNSEEARELFEFTMPKDVEREFLKENGNSKGLYAIDGIVKQWLRKELAFAEN